MARFNYLALLWLIAFRGYFNAPYGRERYDDMNMRQHVYLTNLSSYIVVQPVQPIRRSLHKRWRLQKISYHGPDGFHSFILYAPVYAGVR